LLKNREIDVHTKDYFQEIDKRLLPLDIFETTNWDIEDRPGTVFRDEHDIKPAAWSGQKLTTIVFTRNPSSKLSNSEHGRILHGHRCQWLTESAKEVVRRNWDSVAEGTRYTKSFSNFWNGIFVQLPYLQKKHGEILLCQWQSSEATIQGSYIC
jgi:hypothetical protein